MTKTIPITDEQIVIGIIYASIIFMYIMGFLFISLVSWASVILISFSSLILFSMLNDKFNWLKLAQQNKVTNS